jgi:drug/metabolite transporter (DMT)-like permease
MSFYYAIQSHVNPGVIASLFTSSVFFAGIIFYFVYGEKINLIVLLGMITICASVPCVAIK